MNEMTIARKDIVDNRTTGFYHYTNRRVPKAFHGASLLPRFLSFFELLFRFFKLDIRF